jgi:hypothetical protein
MSLTVSAVILGRFRRPGNRSPNVTERVENGPLSASFGSVRTGRATSSGFCSALELLVEDGDN